MCVHINISHIALICVHINISRVAYLDLSHTIHTHTNTLFHKIETWKHAGVNKTKPI